VLCTPVVEYTSVDAARIVLQGAGFTVCVADPAAATDYREVRFPLGRAAYVVGSEGNGVATGWRHHSVTNVAIPMSGTADSLNVAASAAILLFDAAGRLSRDGAPA
jgi:tRNA G18 (ribose-2'-O)-methylase SpoU